MVPRRKTHSFLAAALATLLLCCSCAKQQRQLFDTIPADSRVIVQANVDRLLKMAGCSSNAGSITLTANLQLLCESVDFLDKDLLAAVAGCGAILDLESTMAFQAAGGPIVVTAPLRSNLENIEPEETSKARIATLGRVKIYDCDNGISLLTADSQGWISRCSPEQMPTFIDSIVATADKEPLSMYLKVATYFDRSSDIKAYCALPQVHNQIGDDFNCVMASIEVNDRTITASAFLGLNGTAVNAVRTLTELNPFVLERMPPRTAAMIAVGLPAGVTDRITPLTSQLPLMQRIAAEAIASMIDSQGGTFAAAAAPGGNAETIRKLNMKSWLFKAIAPMGDNAASAAALIENFINEEAYCQTDSNYVAVTNYDPEDFPMGDDMWTTAATGAQVYMTALVPYQSQLMKALRLKNGYSLEVICHGPTMKATLRMMGSSQYILPTLIADAATLVRLLL